MLDSFLPIQHHPDKGGDEETFKEISKAYQTLSNPDERATYDQFGEAGLAGGGPNAGSYGFPGGGNNPFGSSGGGGGGNPFQSFFSTSSGGTPGSGQGFRTESFSFGQDGNIDLSDLIRQMMGGQDQSAQFASAPQSYTRPGRCTLEDLAKGTTKKMKMTFKGKEKLYTIEIKPGWKAGTKITFNSNSKGIPTMIFEVEEIPHKFLQRKGNDLHFVCWLDKSQLKGGIQVAVPLPTGETYKRKIPKAVDEESTAISDGEKLVIPQKGMPVKGGPHRGDLVIEFRVRRSATSKPG